MGDKSKIEWTDATWNPIRARNLATGKIGWHCEHVSEACRNCYAEGINRRLGTGLDFKPAHRSDIEIFLDEKMLLAPLYWKKPRRIFVNSMTDTFAEFVKDEWLDRMFAVMALAPQHTFQVLTKRPERMRKYVMGRRLAAINFAMQAMDRHAMFSWPLPNVWLGVSAEDQATFEERRQPLRDTPAAVRFFSLEPLLGPIDARDALATGLYHWVICGGESGPHARPMHADWVRSLRDQCAAAAVPFHFKQWGEFGEAEKRRGGYAVADRTTTVLNIDGSARPYRPDGWEPQSPNDPTALMERYGKKAAGRLLDGREHNGMPGEP